MSRALGALLLLGACASDEPGEEATAASGGTGAGTMTTGIVLDETTTTLPRMPAPLIDNAAWLPVDADGDPIPAHRPALVECGAAGAYAEGSAYEMDTSACSYLARSQPALVEVRAGDRLAVAAYHDTLASVEAGQAHFALLLGSVVVWQKVVPIPASPGIVDATPWQDEVVIDYDVEVGTPVGLHLHNHGYNTWTLLEVEVRPSDAP